MSPCFNCGRLIEINKGDSGGTLTICPHCQFENVAFPPNWSTSAAAPEWFHPGKKPAPEFDAAFPAPLANLLKDFTASSQARDQKNTELRERQVIALETIADHLGAYRLFAVQLAENVAKDLLAEQASEVQP